MNPTIMAMNEREEVDQRGFYKVRAKYSLARESDFENVVISHRRSGVTRR